MSWNINQSKDRVKKRDVSPEKIEIIEPSKLPDLQSLKINQMANVDAVNLFVDICGFTERTEKQRNKSIFRILNIFHSEMVSIAQEQKFRGMKVAIQGDRDHIVFCYPKSPKTQIITSAVECGISMLTCVKKVINPYFSNYDDISISIGIDYGMISAANLGLRGQREPVLIGNCTNFASKLEDEARENEVIVSECIYSNINRDDIKEKFRNKFVRNKLCYSAIDVTWDDFEEEDEKMNTLASLGIFGIARAMDRGEKVGHTKTGKFYLGSENGKTILGERVNIAKPTRSWGRS
jgi:class 3 adenylate cyclase